MLENSKQITIKYSCGKCDHKLDKDLFCISCKYQFDNGEIGNE